MAEYFGCGFAPVAVRQSFLKPNGKIEYDLELRWKRYLSSKVLYIEHFGQRNWENLPELEKKQHE